MKDQCRQLAEETLKHWKPFLLSDFQVSSYRYCFSGKTTSRLKFIDKGMDSSGDVPITFNSESQKMATLQVDSRPDSECLLKIIRSLSRTDMFLI